MSHAATIPVEVTAVEQVTPLLISINARYRSAAGIRITGLPAGAHWG